MIELASKHAFRNVFSELYNLLTGTSELCFRLPPPHHLDLWFLLIRSLELSLQCEDADTGQELEVSPDSRKDLTRI